MLFTKKYAPKNTKEVIGQDITKVLAAIKSKKPVLIYGPPGTGKTSTAYAIAKEFNYNVLEINASDERSKKDLEQLIPAVKENSLFRKNKLILIDEIDGLGAEDRGGVRGIINLIKHSKFPIILTANDPWDSKFKELRSLCEIVEFKPLKQRDIEKRLKYIVKNENLTIDERIIKEIAEKSKGDLRGALNDLQSIAFSEDKSVDVLSRNLQSQIYEILGRIFKGKTFLGLLSALENTDFEPEELMYWIEHNVFREYEKIDEIKSAIENISKANYLIEFIRRSQYWRLLVYVNFFLSVGVGMSKHGVYHKFTGYKQPDVFLLKWQNANTNAIKNAILEKLSQKLHVPTQQIKELFEVYNKILLEYPKLLDEFEITSEEKKYLKEHLKKIEKESKNNPVQNI